MLKQMLASIGFNVPIQITYIPDILFITNIYTTSEYNETHPHTYDNLHRPSLNQN